MQPRAKPPFRADQVGSLLRPKSARDARSCRGDFRSARISASVYGFIAEALFDTFDVDGFFLEYDDARSSGFGSTEEGNDLTEKEEATKLRLVAETTREVWG